MQLIGSKYFSENDVYSVEWDVKPHQHILLPLLVLFDAGEGDAVCQLLPESEAHSVTERSCVLTSSPQHADLQQGMYITVSRVQYANLVFF